MAFKCSNKKCQNKQISFNLVTMPSNPFEYRYKQEIVEPMVQNNPFPREQCRQLLNKPLGRNLQHDYKQCWDVPVWCIRWKLEVSYCTFKVTLWTIVSLWIWWQLFSTSSNNFSMFTAQELRTSLLSCLLRKHTTPAGLSTLAINAFDTTISERCFSVSCTSRGD